MRKGEKAREKRMRVFMTNRKKEINGVKEKNVCVEIEREEQKKKREKELGMRYEERERL